MPKSTHGVALLAVVALAGCNTYYNDIPSPDDLMHAVPWFDHMITSLAVHPYGRADVPRNTPPGTIPVTGGEIDWRAEFASGNATTADALANPMAGLATARGDTLYQRFCSVCHGMSGAGDGLVGPKVGAPSLLTPRAGAYSDGYLYSMIRYGRGLMGQYGDKIWDQQDRWAVVNHLRQLQAAAGGSR